MKKAKIIINLRTDQVNVCGILADLKISLSLFNDEDSVAKP